MWFLEIYLGPDRNHAHRVDRVIAGVIVPLDVVEFNGFADAGLLIQVAPLGELILQLVDIVDTCAAFDVVAMPRLK